MQVEGRIEFPPFAIRSKTPDAKSIGFERGAVEDALDVDNKMVGSDQRSDRVKAQLPNLPCATATMSASAGGILSMGVSVKPYSVLASSSSASGSCTRTDSERS